MVNFTGGNHFGGGRYAHNLPQGRQHGLMALEANHLGVGITLVRVVRRHQLAQLTDFHARHRRLDDHALNFSDTPANIDQTATLDSTLKCTGQIIKCLSQLGASIIVLSLELACLFSRCDGV